MFAVLYAPNFRLQAVLRYSPQWVEEPVGLVDVVSGGKAHVVEMSAQAFSSRVEVGMTPTQASARCPQIRLVSGDAGHERSAADIMLQSAEQLSPFIEATGPGVVTVQCPPERNITDKEFAAQIIQPLCSLGLDVRIGAAETPFLALLAARTAHPVCRIENPNAFLKPLPIDVLQPSAELSGTLRAWGIQTIGQLRALPARETCERLGPEAVTLWTRASGGRPRPLELVQPVVHYAESSELEHAIETLEPLLFLLRRFLEQLTVRLEAAYMVVGKLRLGLRFDSGSPHYRDFVIPQPTTNVELLFRTLHTHLENFTAESPVIAVELSASPVRPTTEQFNLLERGLKDPHQLAETLARLGALLGTDRVGTPQLKPSRHPDAFEVRPYDPNASPLPESDLPQLGVPWSRFRPAIEARVVLSDGAPAYLYSSRVTGTVHERRGPWRIAGDWWAKDAWAREEWDVETDDGYYRLVRVGNGWFIDGIYF